MENGQIQAYNGFCKGYILFNINEMKINCQAKMVIGLPSGAKAEELDHEEIHEKFVKKLAQVTKFDLNALFNFNYIAFERPLCQTQRLTQDSSMKHISC